ncbi:transmembrane amino acid transporter protein-domain-containing protein [Protomyces lactucae-debilis]|uniref:Transmembrane amino acid transporter protein-domain-containing protein n=1 Tax=Protomyces lactucae-debilis TaxID=2754530 RepID=A0A1Y2FW77_PROLT|nr:transmembrane amino acid transporter protein-domain-containing protein [Protomyces lactucae-debilis]ORY87554.1 transmembrane amino acid transporter protein-domain-containing protein [Protomyces lactucae-debilis]
MYDNPQSRTEGFHVGSVPSAGQSQENTGNNAPLEAYGSPGSGQQQGAEDARIVDRHLGEAATEDEFASLQLQGGDVHRQVYQWSQQQKQQSLQARRSQSFYIPRPQANDETLDPRNLKVPGGFRRQHLAAKHEEGEEEAAQHEDYFTAGSNGKLQGEPFLTRNFIEFLSLYGHFAGEDLEEEEEESDDMISDEADAGFADAETETEGAGGAGDGEQRPLLMPRKSTRRGRKFEEQGDASVFKAVLLLLKSFVGTGVLFLPKAFLNGGMLFSSIILLAVSAISLYCFLLLVNTRLAVPASFGDIGGILYGSKMRNAILFSIAISQIGFVCAYTAFTAENLGAFIKAVTNGKTQWDISWLIAIQLVVFLPLSMIRDISKLGFTALIADFFILLGLVYLYYADISQIIDRGVSDIVLFNGTDWTLFIGTAIFTFEGIGLIIPITQSMKEPEKFPAALGGVMLFITILFTSIGALSYAAFGSATKTVILSNLRQTNRFVNAVQLLYSMAILLSTPLQLFPAIRILETAVFTKSGKYSPKTKWTKNMFRVVIVVGASFIAWVGANDLDKFVSLIGSFACVPLVFIYPPLLHLKGVSQTRAQKGADITLAVFGVLAMFYTTATSISSWIS